LSFGAVAILLWSSQGYVRRPAIPGSAVLAIAIGNLRRLGTLQVALLTGLFPLTLLIFGRFSGIAPLMNLLVLPIFNFVTVPFCLAGMMLGGPLQAVGDQLLVVAYNSIRLVLWMVSIAADLPAVRFEIHSLAGWAVATAFLPALHVLLPAGWPGRKLALLAIVAVLAYRPHGPPSGCLDYHMLDVGQGLAVVVRAGDHTLLFGTGPSFRSGSSTAELVVMPFLRSRGIGRLDTLVVSHADQDHAGGMQAIASQFAIGRTYVGEYVTGVGLDQIPCSEVSPWSVNNVRFEFLHPSREADWQGNNASYVLEISTGRHKLLLTGDIAAPVEATLLQNSLLQRVDAVVIPHHGSRTSSSPQFVELLSPDLAMVSAGFGNRWGFPKEDVVRRWQLSGARLLDTATAGAISQRICVDSGVEALQLERRESRKYWH
jgi:competence protein ComEC